MQCSFSKNAHTLPQHVLISLSMLHGHLMHRRLPLLLELLPNTSHTADRALPNEILSARLTHACHLRPSSILLGESVAA
jgi:hypothetical protein